LPENAISDVVESEMGFHILHCKKIYLANVMNLEQAKPRIRQSLQDRSRAQLQRQWIASLPTATVEEVDYV